MLKHLRIQNFKGWKDTGTIDLTPITVLFGSNSSGKSSIGQFLVMLKQTVQQADRKAVLMLSGEQTSVDLGTPSDVFYNHNLENAIRFAYDWDLEDQSRVENTSKKEQYDRIEFHGNIGVTGTNTQNLEVRKFEYHLYQNDEEKLTVGMEKSNGSTDKKNAKDNSRNYELFSTPHDYFKRSKGRPWGLTEPVRYYGFSDTALASYQDSDFLQDLNLHQENLFSKFFYLGPLRTNPKRIYSWAGINPGSVGDNGEKTIDAILTAKGQNRRLGLKKSGNKKASYAPFEVIIANALKQMQLVESYKIEQIGNRQDYEVKVRIKGSGQFVSLPDVGFGVSQVLPVIVQLFYAPSGSTIFIEQPELHLHPRAQALLADVMIDAIHMRENRIDRNIQVIIETHSEHFLRRLQRRIADQTAAPTEIKAYFANNNAKESRLEDLQVDSYGNILNWPEEFFGDMDGDIYERSRLVVERKIKERNNAGN